MTHDTTGILSYKKEKAKTTKTSHNNTRIDSSRIKETTPVKTLPSFQQFNLDRLNIKPILYCEMVEMAGVENETQEELQSQIIDFYVCLPNKIDLKLSANSKVSEIIKTIHKGFCDQKHPDSFFQIYTDEYGEERLYIVEFIEVQCRQTGACIPLGYLPEIKKKDKEGHDALVKLFQIIHNKTNVNFVGFDCNWGLPDMAKENFTGYFDKSDANWKEEKAQARKEINAYKGKGIAKQYYDLICCQKTDWNISELALIYKYIPVSELTYWLNKMQGFLARKCYPVQQFDYNCEDPKEENGSMLKYSQYIGFYWKEDWLFKEIDSLYEQTAQQIGIVNPCWTKSYTIDGVNGEVSNDNWPALFERLMIEFNENVLPNILKHYDIPKEEYGYN
jgi:hypothetical protein